MKKGFIIAFPTDTVYGIGTPYDDLVGVKRINELKHRNNTQRMAVLCSSVKMIESLAIVNEEARKLIDAFMPGAFTIILKSTKEYFEKTLEDTVGIRIPNHQQALKIIDKYGPLKTTSINDHGEKPINDVNEIIQTYGDFIDEIYNPDNEALSGISSTVVDFSSNCIRMLREGDIKLIDCVKALSKQAIE